MTTFKGGRMYVALGLELHAAEVWVKEQIRAHPQCEISADERVRRSDKDRRSTRA
jgi:hypothetical protein